MSVFACLSAALLAALLPLSVQSADAAHGSPARSVAESAAFPDPPSDFALALEPSPRFLADVRNSISAPARRGDYAWPTGTETRVLRSFDLPEQRWLSGHRGVDLSLDAGATVLAAGTGEVIYAAMLNDRPVVSIQHEDGIRTTYEPVSPLVRKGERIEAGTPLGILEPGHCAQADCLHWGAKRGRDGYLDPLSLLDDRRIRLLE